ncbi:MAG: hypothetical protein QM777_10790 [Pseudorhodoferax sp.]
MSFPFTRRSAAALAGLAVLALLPAGAALAGAPYAVNLATRFLIYGLAAVSLDLVLGYGAMVSFGHAMFFGLGGYVVAIVAHHALEAGPVSAGAAPCRRWWCGRWRWPAAACWARWSATSRCARAACSSS